MIYTLKTICLTFQLATTRSEKEMLISNTEEDVILIGWPYLYFVPIYDNASLHQEEIHSK
jgi:hypothetical protein